MSIKKYTFYIIFKKVNNKRSSCLFVIGPSEDYENIIW